MKRIYLVIVMHCVTLSLFAQATDLVIDNQTPGWLSSKINYGDQLTVKNLTVTGYINATDLQFIGTLTTYNLTGKIDLSEANVVKESSSGKDNYIGTNAFSTTSTTVSSLILPKSLKEIYSCFTTALTIDTLVFDCDINYVKKDFFGNVPHNIILGENVDSIPNEAFSGSTKLQSVEIRGNVRYIGDRAFYNVPIKSCNFPEGLTYIGNSSFYGHNMKKIILPDYVQTIGSSAFHNTEEIEEVVLPKQMEMLGSKAFDNYAPEEIEIPYGITNPYMNTFKFTEGQVWRFPETVEFIKEITCGNNRCIFYLESLDVVGIDSKLLYSSVSVEEAMRNNYLSGLTVYVHKGMTQKYNSSNYWYSATYLDKDQSGGYTYRPKGYYVTCYWAPATFIERSISVTGLSLSQSTLTLYNIGETIALNAIIEPANADDKSVKWTSTNSDVCIVDSNGNVVATGYGMAVIVCSSTDGGYVATCVVTVTDPTGIGNATIEHTNIDSMYDLSGRKLSTMEKVRKGVYIKNGKKVVVK